MGVDHYLILGCKQDLNVDDLLLNDNLFNFIGKSFDQELLNYINEQLTYLIDDDYRLLDKNDSCKELLKVIINKSNKKSKKNVFVELKRQIFYFIFEHLNEKIKDVFLNYNLYDNIVILIIGYNIENLNFDQIKCLNVDKIKQIMSILNINSNIICFRFTY